MSKFSKYVIEGEVGFHFHCPGCNMTHGIVTDRIKPGPKWNFSGGLDNPTVSPSILVRYWKTPIPPPKDENGKYLLDENGKIVGSKKMVCHSFVREGKIQFLNDCTHELAGETVELGEF